MAEKKNSFNFDRAYLELEEINEWFRNEEINLEEGLKKFRRGLKLIKQCKNRLKEVENEFHDIKKEFAIEESESLGREKESANPNDN